MMSSQKNLYLTSEQLHDLRKTIERAEEREADETYAQSSIVSITRESAEQVQRKAFWAAVDAKVAPSPPKTRTLTLVRHG